MSFQVLLFFPEKCFFSIFFFFKGCFFSRGVDYFSECSFFQVNLFFSEGCWFLFRGVFVCFSEGLCFFFNWSSIFSEWSSFFFFREELVFSRRVSVCMECFSFKGFFVFPSFFFFFNVLLQRVLFFAMQEVVFLCA